jgi:ribose transport system substrate-binding protein
MKKVWVLAALAACVAIVVTGCGSSSGDSSSGSTEASSGGGESSSSIVAEAEAASAKSEEVPQKIAASALPKYKPKTGFKIAYINCDEAVEGCANQYIGFAAAAKVLGWSVDDCDAKFEIPLVIKCFENAINANVDAIVINGFSATDVAVGYESAEKAGIPIIGSFTGNKPDAPGVKADMALTQGLTQGKEVADWVIADSGGKANALWVGETTLAIDRQRKASFEEEMKKCTECVVSDIQFSQASAETQLPQQLQAKVTSDPDINYIIGTYDSVALAAANAVRNAGKSESIKVIGEDANIPNLELIKKGEIQVADAASASREPGWTTADATARVLSGVSVPHDVKTATMIITPNNITELPNEEFQGAIEFEKQFEDLWEK